MYIFTIITGLMKRLLKYKTVIWILIDAFWYWNIKPLLIISLIIGMMLFTYSALNSKNRTIVELIIWSWFSFNFHWILTDIFIKSEILTRMTSIYLIIALVLTVYAKIKKINLNLL